MLARCLTAAAPQSRTTRFNCAMWRSCLSGTLNDAAVLLDLARGCKRLEVSSACSLSVCKVVQVVQVVPRGGANVRGVTGWYRISSPVPF